MSDALKELKWLKRLLADLGVTHDTPMELFCDSITVRLLFISQQTLFFMSVLSILNQIVTV